MNTKIFWVLFLFFSICEETVSGAAGWSTVISTKDQSDAEIAFKMDSLFHLFAAEQGFNGNVLIAQKGKIIYKNTFGYADIEEKTPLNIKSVFEIGSITKQFTAMAVMMLHDEEKLNFNDPVRRFIPRFPYKDITIHQLLTHRSGLPEYMRFAKRYWKDKKRLMKNADLMHILIKYHPSLIFRPNKRYYYSNTGYIVLACIVERISGIDFSTFLEKRIFWRLGMTSSFVSDKKNIEYIEYPTLGHKESKEKAKEDFLCGTIGDKGIYSTVEDMYKWDQILYTETLVHQSTLREAFTPFSYDSQNENNYGYGWRILTQEGGSKIVYHAGWWRGYSGLFARRLADKSTVIILCNKVNWSYENIDLLMDILDMPKQNIMIRDKD